MTRLTTLMLACALFASCAFPSRDPSLNYSQVFLLTEFERASLTCEQLDDEIVKCKMLLDATYRDPKLGGEQAGSWQKRRDIRASADSRIESILAAKRARGCP